MQIGESFIGAGVDAAHVNTVVGPRSGPVGTAWATALASPSAGHAPFVCVLQPGLPVAPPTLFVNKARIAGDRHGELTWGPAQAGVATGVRAALLDGTLGEPVDDLVVIAAVWVDPDAATDQAVFDNNAAATRQALAAGAAGMPRPADIEAVSVAWNPFFDPRGTG